MIEKITQLALICGGVACYSASGYAQAPTTESGAAFASALEVSAGDCQNCGCCDGHCALVETYGVGGWYSPVTCGGGTCQYCPPPDPKGPSGSDALEAIKALWTAAASGQLEVEELNALLEKYGAVATHNPKRRSIQVRSCGDELVANIPLTLAYLTKEHHDR